MLKIIYKKIGQKYKKKKTMRFIKINKFTNEKNLLFAI